MDVRASSESHGVDFIAFVREVWRAKWTFGGIFIAVTTFLLLAHVLVVKTAPNGVATAGPHYAYFQFTNHVELDPFNRNSAQIFGDFLDILASIDTLGLVGERDYITGDLPPERRFFVQSFGDYSGRVKLEIRDKSGALFEQIRAEFLEAARLQFEATKSRATDELNILKEFSTNTYDKRSDFIAEKMYRNVRFLEDKAVSSGSFRYFNFFRLQQYPAVEQPKSWSNNGDSTNKSIGISLIFGLIFASLFIAVRMEVNKEKRYRWTYRRATPADKRARGRARGQ